MQNLDTIKNHLRYLQSRCKKKIPCLQYLHHDCNNRTYHNTASASLKEVRPCDPEFQKVSGSSGDCSLKLVPSGILYDYCANYFAK